MAGAQYHNVIIFGAGASFDAGIPLLPSFVDKMWEYAIRGKVGKVPLSDEDKDILTKANKIRLELERYNSRAFFDNRNLEDILSLLSFEALSDDEQKEKYNTMVKAVARTIELSCNIPHQDTPNSPDFPHTSYYPFWLQLLNTPLVTNLPAIITFNYDLVLERSLWQFFHGLQPRGNVNSCGLKYGFGDNDFSVIHAPHKYPADTGRGIPVRDGLKAAYIRGQPTQADIPYFKLHGSLNWSQDNPLVSPSTHPTAAVPLPFILPPVFNKMSKTEVNQIWKGALDVLRRAKRLIIVGYSLPKTDIYMQYFLKSAVGPNSDLDKILVFDPTLYKNNEDSAQMKRRYQECFSPQFTNRIKFEPAAEAMTGSSRGTFAHFVYALNSYKDELFFFP